MRIQHNIAALSAYRNLTNNNSAVSKNLEKLSSGYRINRAGDDAAGLAISEKMRAQITGLKTAQKNASDGISLIQTAEGALTEVHSMLNRMVELASQSANGTYSTEDRANLQEEVDALLEEIDRISKSTNFNGTNLLDGSLGLNPATAASSKVTVDQKESDFEIDTNAITAIKDGEVSETPKKLKFTLDLSNVSIVNNNSAAASSIAASKIALKIGNTTISLSGAGLAGNGGTLAGADLVNAINTAIGANGITMGSGATAVGFTVKANGTTLEFEMKKDPTAAFDEDLTASISVNASSTDKVEMNQAEAIAVRIEQDAVVGGTRKYAQAEYVPQNITDGYALKIGDETYVFAVGKDSKFKDVTNIEGLGAIKVVNMTSMEDGDPNLAKAAINELSKVAAGNAKFKVGSDNKGTIGITEKKDAFNNYDEYDLDGDPTVAADADWSKVIKEVTLTGLTKTDTPAAAASGGLTLQIGDTADIFNKMVVNVESMDRNGLNIAGVDVRTDTAASASIDMIKDAINSVSTQRGKLGALQNRLEHTINNLSVTTENITAAESRIRDVDMAEEMMAYTKNNILVQASQAMLAQANQIPQGVLQLLQ